MFQHRVQRAYPAKHVLSVSLLLVIGNNLYSDCNRPTPVPDKGGSRRESASKELTTCFTI